MRRSPSLQMEVRSRSGIAVADTFRRTVAVEEGSNGKFLHRLTMRLFWLTMRLVFQDAINRVSTIWVLLFILNCMYCRKICPHPPTPSPNIERSRVNLKVPLPSLGEGFRVRAFDSCKKSITSKTDLVSTWFNQISDRFHQCIWIYWFGNMHLKSCG